MLSRKTCFMCIVRQILAARQTLGTLGLSTAIYLRLGEDAGCYISVCVTWNALSISPWPISLLKGWVEGRQPVLSTGVCTTTATQQGMETAEKEFLYLFIHHALSSSSCTGLQTREHILMPGLEALWRPNLSWLSRWQRDTFSGQKLLESQPRLCKI